MDMYLYMYVQNCTCMHRYIHACIPTYNSSTYKHANIYSYISMCIYIMYVRYIGPMYICTHTLLLLVDLCLLRRFKCLKSPLLSLLGLFFNLSISTCHHPIQHHLSWSSSCTPLSICLWM